jgi:hypothetical protein
VRGLSVRSVVPDKPSTYLAHSSFAHSSVAPCGVLAATRSLVFGRHDYINSNTAMRSGPHPIFRATAEPDTVRPSIKTPAIAVLARLPRRSPATTVVIVGRGGSCALPPALRAYPVIPRTMVPPCTAASRTRSASGHVADCEADGYALSAGGRAQDPPLPNPNGVVAGNRRVSVVAGNRRGSVVAVGSAAECEKSTWGTGAHARSPMWYTDLFMCSTDKRTLSSEGSRSSSVADGRGRFDPRGSWSYALKLMLILRAA